MIAMGAYFPIIDIAVPIAVRMLGYSELVKGVILMIANGLPLIFYPIFARLSDNSRSRIGRRTPFIYAGVALCAASLIGAVFQPKAAKSGCSAHSLPYRPSALPYTVRRRNHLCPT